MNIINTILGFPLGYVIYTAYGLTGSYGAAILIFAFAARAVMFPVNMLAHRNAIRLLQIQPSLTAIKRRHAGDRERLHEEQYNLFKKEKYSPYVGLVPLVVQLVLIMGIMQVMYNPLQHLLHFGGGAIEAMVQASHEASDASGGYGEQLRVIEALRRPENLPLFREALLGFPDAEGMLSAAAGVDMNFMGLNLGETPSPSSPSAALIVPALSGITALLFCLVQSAISPGALSQGKGANYSLTGFTIAL